MYKRPARIVFVSSKGDFSQAAANYANRVGDQWLQARSLVTQQGDPTRRTELLLWGDLFVYLDKVASLSFPVDSPSAQKKQWYPSKVDRVAKISELESRIDGMVGGIKMMS